MSELIIKKSVLLATLEGVLLGTKIDTTLPVLASVLFLAKGDVSTITTTNTNILISKGIKLENTLDKDVVFKRCIDAKLLYDLTRFADGDTVELLEEDATSVTFLCGTNQLALQTLDVKTFPLIAKSPDIVDFEISGEKLAEALKICSTFSSNDESRPVLTTVSVKTKKETTDNGDITKLDFLSTNGFVFASVEVKLQANLDDDIDICIPGDSCKILAALAAKDENCKIVIGDSTIFFSGEFSLIIKLFSGKHPGNKFPMDFASSARVNRRKLLEGLSIISTLEAKDGGKNPTPINILIDEDEQLVLSSKLSNYTNSFKTVKVGSTVNINLNGKIIEIFLKLIEDDEIDVKYRVSEVAGKPAPVDIVPVKKDNIRITIAQVKV